MITLTFDKSTTLIVYGGVAEWLKAPVSKAGNGATRSGVQIPLLRQSFFRNPTQSLNRTYLSNQGQLPHSQIHIQGQNYKHPWTR